MIFEGARDMGADRRRENDRLPWPEAAKMILVLSFLLWVAVVFVI